MEQKVFNTLRNYYGGHGKAAAALGINYRTYWLWRKGKIPKYGKRLLQLEYERVAAKMPINHTPPGKPIRKVTR